MPSLLLVLVSLVGLAQRPSLVDPGSLLLDCDLVARPGQLDEIGQTLGRGVPLGIASLGLEGQPSAPFLGTFLHQQEIQAPTFQLTSPDPALVASTVMVQLRVTLDPF